MQREPSSRSPLRSGPVTSRIIGTGHYAPARVLTNRDLERMVDTSDEWIVERTGIRERHIAADGEASSDMAAAAARQALEAAGLQASELDLIIIATISPDQPLPATAVFVQHKIGARSDCPAFDIAAACAGFIYGLSIADKFIASGVARHVLVVGVELLSRVVDWKDRTTCVLFGDGAGAAIVSKSDGMRGLLSTHIYADGSQAAALQIPAGGSAAPASQLTIDAGLHYVHMAGQDVFKYAVRALSSASLTALEANGVTKEQVTWVVPHQANLRILEAVSKRVGIELTRFVLNIARFGNTSSASIPIALDEAVRAGTVREGDLVLMCALGAGFAWGSALIRF
ncbi:MAG: 3-oxoacyl-[acyl-carrier-protein] synthase [Myxococcaceae bacterium]|nr:3-oxoacyl-[acyl-carrier-protein] synthase [Myxococcaceae bacterium]